MYIMTSLDDSKDDDINFNYFRVAIAPELDKVVCSNLINDQYVLVNLQIC